MTLLNGRPVPQPEARMMPGDVLGIGEIEFRDLLVRCRVFVLGNFDQVTMYDPEGFGSTAALHSVFLAREQLFEATEEPQEARLRRWARVSAWPRQHREGSRLLVHASPRNPVNEYLFPEDIYNQRKMEANFALIDHLCFVGHTHLPEVFVEIAPGEPCEFRSPEEIGSVYTIDARKTIINVGSVGQPRDGDPRSCYILLQGNRVTFRRVEYDVRTTVQKIYANEQLENYLGDRLRDGR